MTPTQFRIARKNLGLSQAEMAKALSLKTARAIRHYEDGTRQISGPIEFIIVDVLLKNRGLSISPLDTP